MNDMSKLNDLDRLKLINYWNKQVDVEFPRSVQAVLHSKMMNNNQGGIASCGQGSCNCGGGCNGECATSCES